MLRRTALKAASAAVLAIALGTPAASQSDDDMTQASFDTVMSFMGAMGGGDMDTMANLMADDMVWLNGGDPSLPWIGRWEGKEAIFGFLGTFSENAAPTLWENEDSFASGDTVAVFGRMKLMLKKSGVETDEFNFALRAKVRDGQVVLWNWFEDSFAVSEAYHGK